jgi:hypothetical protein
MAIGVVMSILVMSSLLLLEMPNPLAQMEWTFFDDDEFIEERRSRGEKNREFMDTAIEERRIEWRRNNWEEWSIERVEWGSKIENGQRGFEAKLNVNKSG